MIISSQKITIENFDKFNSLPANQVKLFVKNSISNLPSFSYKEENNLICLATGLTPAQLVLFKEFNKESLKKIKKFLLYRMKNMPLNKIAKISYFYLDKFYINNNVLAPRPETELLVENVLGYIEKIKEDNVRVLDLCCGSGAIGLSIAKNAKNCFVTLSDISNKALKVTRKNQRLLQVKKTTNIVKSNMFQRLKNNYIFDIIVSNPPYIKTGDISNLDASVTKYDPIIALDGGEDGLKFYKIIAKSAKNFLTPYGQIFLEIGYEQAKDVKQLFEDSGYEVKILKDYANLDRIVIAKKKV